MTYRAAITGWGDGLPRTAVSNLDLITSFNLETSNEWIVQRTGIESRYIADQDETVLSLGIQASRKALERANVSPEEVDLVIVTTVTAERAFPSTAIEIQERLGMKNAIGFDLQAACSGFVYTAWRSRTFMCGAIKRGQSCWSERISCLGCWIGGIGIRAFCLATGPEPR